jgi:BirA family biotin operon repressor/biotin-[acetyl-CoA-carboxylase] ligase
VNHTRLIEYEELDSTNDEAKRLVRAGTSELYGTVITARRQTAGRGRKGRGFLSPGSGGTQPGSIYASFILEPPENLAEQFITALAAVAVCEAIEETTSYEPGIKWINDVLVDGKKICGILAESIPGAVILGIGVNINLKIDDLPQELTDTVGSLKMDEKERQCFFNALVGNVFRCVPGSPMDAYRKRSILTGQNIIIIQGENKRPAKALGVADDGALIVEYEDGSVCELRTGEITVRVAGHESLSV